MSEKMPAFSMNFKPVREITAFSVDAITSLAQDYTLIGTLGYSSTELTGYGNFAFHTRPVEGFSHNVFKDGSREPECCGYHQEIYKTILPKLTKAEEPLQIARKILLVLAYTQEYIITICKDYAANKIPEHYLNYIYDYVEYSCVSFGVDGIGHDLYLFHLKKFVENSDIDDKTKQKALEYIALAETLFNQSGLSNETFQDVLTITNRWVNLFPFELGSLAEIKQELRDHPIVPVTKKSNAFLIDLIFVSNQINNDVIQVLCETSEFLLENISSVYMFEKGLLTDPNKRKLDLLVSGRKHKLKTGYSTSEESREAYLDVIEEWFVDEKEFLNEITPLIKAQPEEQVNTKPAIPNDIPTKLISFTNNEVLEKVYILLKGYFPGKEEDLKRALRGEQLTEKIIFPHNQNRLVEVFKRLKYNGLILESKYQINQWLRANFKYQYERGKEREIRNLSEVTIKQLLSSGKGEPKKEQRICYEGVDWLPYKNQATLEREEKKEKL